MTFLIASKLLQQVREVPMNVGAIGLWFHLDREDAVNQRELQRLVGSHRLVSSIFGVRREHAVQNRLLSEQWSIRQAVVVPAQRPVGRAFDRSAPPAEPLTFELNHSLTFGWCCPS